jgi:hypothetical protein
MLTEAMAKRIEIWPIERLVPYARNPRTHSAEQVAQIAASIGEFGFNCPILVDSEAGIIAGHGRLLGAQKLDLKESPGDRFGPPHTGPASGLPDRRQQASRERRLE